MKIFQTLPTALMIWLIIGCLSPNLGKDFWSNILLRWK